MSAPRALQSIGINIFITHFETFIQLRNRKNIADFCIKNGISNENGALIRASNMENVIKDKNLLKKCLIYIIYESKKNSSITKR